MKSRLFFAFLAVVLVTSSAWAGDIAAVQRAIAASGAPWTAGETSMSHLTEAEFAQYLNLVIEIPDDAEAYVNNIEVPADMPAHLDWRDIDGQNFVTPVKDQHPCGTCATFSSVGAFEALFKIAVNNPFIEPDLSEQHVYSCEGPIPYTFFHPMIYLKGNGAPDDACFVYDCDFASERRPCDESCDDWQTRAHRTKSYRMMMFPNPEQMKAALQDGPIVAGFQVFADFQDYTGGVYEHQTGGILGGHGVVVAGYDDEGEYWICKNSWGTDWGEDGGWFRIKWGHGLLGFGYQSFDITVDVDSVCSESVEPTIAALALHNAETALAADADLEISFAYDDPNADLAGGELWYVVDDEAAVRYDAPLRELLGTSSAGRDAVVYSLTGPFAPGEHELTVYVKDLCGAVSNELSATFVVEGGPGDDDDNTAPSDDDDDNTAPTGDDDDDDDDDSGCGG